MKTQTSQTKKSIYKIIPLLLFGMISVVPLALALPAPSGTDKSIQMVLAPQKVLFKYQIEGRPDPFVPFISEKSASANINEIVPVAEQLSGMQLFEPGQLNLVAMSLQERMILPWPKIPLEKVISSRQG